MSELMIDGVNWLDPRMIGLKCVFSDDFHHIVGRHGRDGVLHHIDRKEEDYPFEDEYGNQYRCCRLAQGEITAYEDEGEKPLPDNVEVELWNKSGHSWKAKTPFVSWVVVAYYQVQEQSQMPVKDHLNLLLQDEEQSKTDRDFVSRVHSWKDGDITITTETRDEIKRLLTNYRSIKIRECDYLDGQELNSKINALLEKLK